MPSQYPPVNRSFGIWIKLAFIDANDEYKEGRVNGKICSYWIRVPLAAELLFLTALAGLWPRYPGVMQISGPDG